VTMSRYSLPLSGYDNASVWGYDDQDADRCRCIEIDRRRGARILAAILIAGTSVYAGQGS
jgi:hypothetical protein